MLKMTLVLAAAMILAACSSTPDAPLKTYVNPIIDREGKGGADPAVIYHEGTYYYLGTTGKIDVHISKDLVHWERGPQVLPDEFKDAWASEFYYHPEDGKFYIYYTKRYKIGVAVGTRPDSMFTDLGFLAIPAIDAHPFRDDDGRLYLYFTWTPSFTMYCVPMVGPTETGGPVTKCFDPRDQEWEKVETGVNEGPWMEKRNGKYTMMYSGADGRTRYYSIGIAHAPTPIGPFTKYEKNPVFRDLSKISGPAHGSVTMDRTGQLWHLYHQKPDTNVGWARDICLDKLYYDDECILRGNPTRGETLVAPNCDENLVWVPEFVPRGAIFNESVEVALKCRSEGAEIRYTVDGTEPGKKSALYEKPFKVAATTTVKARAFKSGMTQSYVGQEVFTKTEEKLASNPAPHDPQNDPPFDVFKKPVGEEWRKLVKKSTPPKNKK